MSKNIKALALNYNSNLMDAPVISAIGSNELAKAMCQQARRSGIPVVASDSIVNAMKSCEINQAVPEETYSHIAKIFNKYSIE